jgi:hypothetical protein
LWDYFVDLSGNPSRVLLWSHDPPGIEDPDLGLEEFLRDFEQSDRIDFPLERGFLWICRTPTYAESILKPLMLEEWVDAVRSTDGLEYQGYREGKTVHVMPAFCARDAVFDTTPTLTPRARAVSRTLSACWRRSRRISRICLIGSRSVAILEPPSRPLVAEPTYQRHPLSFGAFTSGRFQRSRRRFGRSRCPMSKREHG